MSHPVVLGVVVIVIAVIAGLGYYAYTVYQRNPNVFHSCDYGGTYPNCLPKPASSYVEIAYKQTCDSSCQTYGSKQSADFNITLTNHGYTAIKLYGAVEAFHITISGSTYFLPSLNSPDCIASSANFTISNTDVNLPQGTMYSLSFTGYPASQNCASILDNSGNLNITWVQK